MFSEIVLLPTLAPDLARPYHVPSTPEFIAAQAAREREAFERGQNPTEVPTSLAAAAVPEVEDHLHFFLHVTTEWTERARPKKCTETRNAPETVFAFSMTRTDFVTAALAAFNLQNIYIPGPTSGPKMRISRSVLPEIIC